MLEGVEPGRAGVAFLEGSDFAFDDGSAFEDALFNALAEGCGSGEEALLGTRNHGLLLDAALGAEAQDEAVGNHDLGWSNGAGVHTEGFEHGRETQLLPGFGMA